MMFDSLFLVKRVLSTNPIEYSCLRKTFNLSYHALGAFLRKYTTIKSVSIKKPSDFTTTDYTVKNGKKYKTVAFKPDIDIDNLPLWVDCKPEKTTPKTPVAKKVLSDIKKLLNTIDSIENDTSTLAIVNDIYKSLDNTSKKLEQLLNNINE